MTDYLLSNNDRSTLQYKVTNKLREVILTGEFKQGERLVQEEWATKLGVSRMPIREALQQLEIEGLVKIEPRKGAIVTPISIDDIKEIYYLRSLLEVEAVKRSLPNLSKKDVEELEDLYEQMNELKSEDRQGVEVEKYTKLNKHFHYLLLSGCQWRRIQNMIETLWRGIPSFTPSLLLNQIEEANKEHKLMLKYIKENDSKSLEEIMETHILRTRDKLINMIKENKK